MTHGPPRAAPGTAVTPQDVTALLRKGVQRQQAGDWEGARALYRRALGHQPRHPDTLHLLAMAEHHLGRSEAAIGVIQRALAVRPDFPEALNTLGNIQTAQGRPGEAAASYRRAIALRPGYAVAHLNLGNVLTEEEKFDEALACYRRALEIEPAYAQAHTRIGDVYRLQGKLDEAAVSYRRALALDPRYAVAHHNLGNVLSAQRKLDEARAAYERALALDPTRAETHSQLGAVHQARDRLDQAVACFQRALELEPKDATALAGLGDVLKVQGRFAEARDRFEAALGVNPDFGPAYEGLTSISRIERGDPIIPRIEALLRDERTGTGERVSLLFALGKCLDDIGDYDEAFARYHAANELKKQTAPFDVEGFVAENERSIAVFSRDFLHKTAGWGSDSERPVFIVGMPRSGTTLVEQILASHPQVFEAGELPDVHRMARDLPHRLRSAMPYPDCAVAFTPQSARDLAEEYLSRLTELSPDASRVTDKAPVNFRRLGLIALLFPRARIVHCRRHPMDVGLSCYFQNFRALKFSTDLAHIGLFYREYERLMAHWTALLPNPLLEVRYENLVAEPEAGAQRLVAFCGLEWDAACLAFHETARPVLTASHWQARQPVYTRSVDRWRRYERHLGPLRRALEGSLDSGAPAE